MNKYLCMLAIAAAGGMHAPPLYAATRGEDRIFISTPTPSEDPRLSTTTIGQRFPLLNMSTSPLDSIMIRDFGEDSAAPSSFTALGGVETTGFDRRRPFIFRRRETSPNGSREETRTGSENSR